MRDAESFIEPVGKWSREKGQPEQNFHRELSHFISSKTGKKMEESRKRSQWNNKTRQMVMVLLTTQEPETISNFRSGIIFWNSKHASCLHSDSSEGIVYQSTQNWMVIAKMQKEKKKELAFHSEIDFEIHSTNKVVDGKAFKEWNPEFWGSKAAWRT